MVRINVQLKGKVEKRHRKDAQKWCTMFCLCVSFYQVTRFPSGMAPSPGTEISGPPWQSEHSSCWNVGHRVPLLLKCWPSCSPIAEMLAIMFPYCWNVGLCSPIAETLAIIFPFCWNVGHRVPLLLKCWPSCSPYCWNILHCLDIRQRVLQKIWNRFTI